MGTEGRGRRAVEHYPWREAHRPSAYRTDLRREAAYHCTSTLYCVAPHRRWKALSKAERCRFEQHVAFLERSASAPPPPPASAPSSEYHSADRLHPRNLPPATPAPATVFWFGLHSSPEVIRKAPMPTAAVAVPMRTSAPDMTRTAAPAPPMAPSAPVATAPAPPPNRSSGWHSSLHHPRHPPLRRHPHLLHPQLVRHPQPLWRALAWSGC